MASSVVGRLVYIITGDKTPLERELSDAQKRVNAAGKLMESSGRKLSAALTLPIAAIGTAFVKSAIEAEATSGKFRTAFRDVGDQADAAATRLQQSYGLARTEAERLLAGTGDLLKGFGATGSQALLLSNEVQKLAVDLAAYSNLQGGASRASEILTKAMLGEREGLTQLGIKISETDVQQRLAAQGLQNLEGRTALLARAQATLQLAMEQSGDAIGAYNRTQDTTAGQLRLLQARASDLAVTMGGQLLPVANRLVGWAVTMVDRFSKLDPHTRSLIVTLGGIAAAAGPALIVGGKLVQTINLLSAAFRVGAGAVSAYSLALAGVVAGIALLAKRARDAKAEQELVDKAIEGSLKTLEDYNRALDLNAERGRNVTKAHEQTADELERLRRDQELARRTIDLFSGSIDRNRAALIENNLVALGYERATARAAVASENHDLILGALNRKLASSSTQVANLSRTESAYVAVKDREAAIRANIQKLMDAEEADRAAVAAQIAAEAAALSNLTRELLASGEAVQGSDNLEDDAAQWAAFAKLRVSRAREASDAEAAAAEETRRNWESAWGGVTQLLTSFGQIQSGISQQRLNDIEAEYGAQRQAIEGSALSEEEKAARISELEAKQEKERRRIMRQDAIRQKALATFQGVIQMARSIIEALPSIARVAFASATGLAQLAAIRATPIPALASGADFMTNGPMLMEVGDNPGGRERVTVTPESSPNIAGPGVIEQPLVIAIDGTPVYRGLLRATQQGIALVANRALVSG